MNVFTCSSFLLSRKPILSIAPFLGKFFRWLFKGILLPELSEARTLLPCMGRGAVKGLNIAGIFCYEPAESSGLYLSCLLAASGANSEVDDLLCFLSSTIYSEATLTFSLR